MRALAIQFATTLKAAPGDGIEDLRVSALQGAITADNVAMLIEHLDDFVSARSQESRDRAARCFTAALADGVEANVTQWHEYQEWDAERFAPCDMDQMRARAER